MEIFFKMMLMGLVESEMPRMLLALHSILTQERDRGSTLSVSHQSSVISHQSSVISHQSSVISHQGWLLIFVAEGGRSHRRDNAPELEERLKTEIQMTNTGRIITAIRA